MPWFICFATPPRSALDFHRNLVGMSAPASLSRDEAIASIQQALQDKGHQHITLVEAYQYLENEDS